MSPLSIVSATVSKLRRARPSSSRAAAAKLIAATLVGERPLRAVVEAVLATLRLRWSPLRVRHLDVRPAVAGAGKDERRHEGQGRDHRATDERALEHLG